MQGQASIHSLHIAIYKKQECVLLVQDDKLICITLAKSEQLFLWPINRLERENHKLKSHVLSVSESKAGLEVWLFHRIASLVTREYFTKMQLLHCKDGSIQDVEHSGIDVIASECTRTNKNTKVFEGPSGTEVLNFSGLYHNCLCIQGIWLSSKPYLAATQQYQERPYADIGIFAPLNQIYLFSIRETKKGYKYDYVSSIKFSKDITASCFMEKDKTPYLLLKYNDGSIVSAAFQPKEKLAKPDRISLFQKKLALIALIAIALLACNFLLPKIYNFRVKPIS